MIAPYAVAGNLPRSTHPAARSQSRIVIRQGAGAPPSRSPQNPWQSNPHRTRRTPHIAVSSLGGFRTPAPERAAPSSCAGIRKPYMRVNLSRPFFVSPLSEVASFCLAPCRAHPSVPTRDLSTPSRAGPVKDGRRADRATRRLISRPLLDWPEHDGKLERVGIALAARRACSADQPSPGYRITGILPGGSGARGDRSSTVRHRHQLR